MKRFAVLLAAPLAASPLAAQSAPPKQFAMCAVCHKTTPDGKGLGPTLAGIANRRVASVPGFAYSPAMKAAKIKWTRAELSAYIAAPQTRVPGTRMAYAGLKDPAANKAVVDYLMTLK